MNSIYNIQSFANATNYRKHDIVKYSGLFNGATLANQYLYCVEDHLSSASPDSAKWNGVTVYNGSVKPLFFWVPDYKNQSVNTPRIKKIVLGDGYEKRAKDGLNNKLIAYNLSFERRSQSEITAIAHFLDNANGINSFIFVGRTPYAVSKLFVCDEEFSITEEFENSFTLNCKFREVVN